MAATRTSKSSASKTAASKSKTKAKASSSSKTKSAKPRRTAAKRELIDTGTDKRYVRRDEKGQFKEVDDVGRSLSQDRRRKSKTVAAPGQGDKGDQKPRRRSKAQ